MGIDGQATLTLPEAARWLGLTVPCVAALVDRGELPCVRDPDGSVRILTAALIEGAGQRGTDIASCSRAACGHTVSPSRCCT